MRNLYKTYLRAGLCLAGFLFYTNATAQYIVSGEILDVDNTFDDVIVELSVNNQKKELQVSNTGHFRTSLDWNQTYYFKFRKSGYVSKVIEFSTVLPDDKQPSAIEPYHMPVRLFRMFEGVDTVFFQNPIAKIHFDKNLGDFEHDIDYSLKVKYRIDQMREKGKSTPNKPVKPINTAQKTAKKKSVKAIESEVGQVKTDKSIVVSNKDEIVIDHNEVVDVPDLKKDYKEGETMEEFNLKNRTIIRHVFLNNGQRRVFLSVKHNWGGHYYFIDEAEIGYRCISKDMYEFFLMNYRNKIKDNK
ncbi:hypothetical protein [Carboxylicivirga sp. RSCT41]|uniref:hypothetical protein n=1 Tax=Carboxylicivirga agarovorans TaxID=3417570 RepID=UPI003D34031E